MLTQLFPHPPKSVYGSFLSENYYEKDYDKKMFVNIGFLLSLPFSMLNTLLSYNGYSLDKSTKKFDEIIDRAFKIGFGRDLAIDLIDFYNFEMLEKYSTKMERGKEVTLYFSFVKFWEISFVKAEEIY